MFAVEADKELRQLRSVEADPQHLKLKAQIAKLCRGVAEDHQRSESLFIRCCLNHYMLHAAGLLI